MNSPAFCSIIHRIICTGTVRLTTAYLDNSATTKPCGEAIEAVVSALETGWGNPSSLHYSGVSASALLEKARHSVAASLGCDDDEIYFTSGGTESNNLALTGAAKKMRRFGSRIVSTAIEHPSVYDTLGALQKEGFEIIRLPVDGYGRVSEEALYEAVTPDTVLISMMYVNNEVGTVLPVRAARRAAARAKSPALIHCDAVQAYGKLEVRPKSLGVNLMTVSSHKIHGPKGAGALYVGRDVSILPSVFGGGQEQKLRPGTQPMPAIAGFGAAAAALTDIKGELLRITELRDYMIERFREEGGIAVNSPGDALPYITNISVLGIKSEPMLNFLSSKGICVSSGSACSKGKKSRVISEMGLPRERAETPLRISFSSFTSKEEIDYLTEMISLGKKEIRNIK